LPEDEEMGVGESSELQMHVAEQNKTLQLQGQLIAYQKTKIQMEAALLAEQKAKFAEQKDGDWLCNRYIFLRKSLL
ncbi:hypothetical protein Tco_0081245, partial [Tanacetum coccineum]